METNKLQNQDSNGELKLRMIIRTGFVNDETGEIVVPCQWRSASDFAEGLAGVEDLDGKSGFIDKTGKVVIPCKWEYAEDFEEGLAAVRNSNDKWGYIDKTGKFVNNE